MTTAELEKRVRTLEKKYEELRQAVKKAPTAIVRMAKPTKTEKKKKLPRWLQASLKDVEEGRVSGPFDTVEALMADLNGPGK